MIDDSIKSNNNNYRKVRVYNVAGRPSLDPFKKSLLWPPFQIQTTTWVNHATYTQTRNRCIAYVWWSMVFEWDFEQLLIADDGSLGDGGRSIQWCILCLLREVHQACLCSACTIVKQFSSLRRVHSSDKPTHISGWEMFSKSVKKMRCLRRKVMAVTKSYLMAALRTRASSSREPMVGSGLG